MIFSHLKFFYDIKISDIKNYTYVSYNVQIL